MSRVVELAALFGLAAMLLLVIRGRIKLAVVLWLAAMCFVPVWMGVSVKVFLLPTVVAGLLVLAALLPLGVRKVSMADVLVAFFALVGVVPLFVGEVSGSFVSMLILQWLVAFMVGRLLPLRVDPRWIYGSIAVFFSVVAVLAIVEYLLRRNPFLLLHADNRLYQTWSPILERGGVGRVEGAFGHPIALGICLAMAIPFVFASRFSTWRKIGMVALMVVAILPTFSRSAMVTAGLSVILSLMFARDGLSARLRVMALIALGAVAVVTVPIVLQVFAEAGSEATNSAGYRENLLSLVPQMSVLGLSPSATRNAYGDLFFDHFRSIDSALILLGLTAGWLALAVVLLLLAGAVVRVVLGRADPATVAVVAGTPALATVALITQYSMFFWFIAGMAVWAQAQRHVPVEASPVPATPVEPVGIQAAARIPVVSSAPIHRPMAGDRLRGAVGQRMRS